MNYSHLNGTHRKVGKEFVRYAAKPILAKVKNFKDIHKGESCYIVGDGISLKYFDFKLLPPKKTIACNYSIFHKEIKLLDLNYCITYAPFFFKSILGRYSKEQRDILNLTSKMTKLKIDEFNKTKFFAHITNYPFLLNKDCYYLLDHLPLDYYDNIQNINSFKNVMESSIVLAIYMGFRDINLLGFDYIHDPSRSHHWYEKGKGVETGIKTVQKSFLESAKELANISSITVDSKAQVINHISYEDLTGAKPMYRENIELASKNFLNTLSTFDDYNIY